MIWNVFCKVSLSNAICIIYFILFFGVIVCVYSDIDECSLNTAICGAGTCLNIEGNYTCVCPEGHMLMPDRNCMGKYFKIFWSVDLFALFSVLGRLLLIVSIYHIYVKIKLRKCCCIKIVLYKFCLLIFYYKS